MLRSHKVKCGKGNYRRKKYIIKVSWFVYKVFYLDFTAWSFLFIETCRDNVPYYEIYFEFILYT